ncbi:MAG TPA: GyrI-like domain-containing protein [Coriobacteriia bacterium]|nr:GyrI-like domain-containing protein [Coriobacteriia bacterium]
MQKVDFRRELAVLYSPSASSVSSVDVPPMNFLMVDGAGDPNTTPAYQEAVEALFSLSYALKFAIKRGPDQLDYSVMPLEGLWWSEDMSSFTSGDRSAWLWTMMIMQPPVVTVDLVASTLSAVSAKKPLPGLSRIRSQEFHEGLAAQTLHVGPFSTEGPTIERVHDFIDESGCSRFGKHHEIYLSDIRKAQPARWKTVIRQPMR